VALRLMCPPKCRARLLLLIVFSWFVKTFLLRRGTAGQPTSGGLYSDVIALVTNYYGNHSAKFPKTLSDQRAMLSGAFDRIALAFAATYAPRIFRRGDTPGGIALVNEGSASFSPERSMPYVNSTSHSLRHSALNRAAATLLVHDLDLLVEHLAGEAVECHACRAEASCEGRCTQYCCSPSTIHVRD
jgi:hypothetical protein